MNNKLGITFLVLYLFYILYTLLRSFPTGAPVIPLPACEEPRAPDGCPNPGVKNYGNKTNATARLTTTRLTTTSLTSTTPTVATLPTAPNRHGGDPERHG